MSVGVSLSVDVPLVPLSVGSPVSVDVPLSVGSPVSVGFPLSVDVPLSFTPKLAK